MSIKNLVKLKEVTEDNAEFLYEMLKERDSTVNVTHQKLPLFNEHVEFIKSKPYDAWYIIEIESKRVGHIYIDNENRIGWFIKREFKGFGFVIPAFEELKILHKRKNYLGKVNPNNFEAQNLLTKLKFVLKNTYPDYLLYEYASDDTD